MIHMMGNKAEPRPRRMRRLLGVLASLYASNTTTGHDPCSCCFFGGVLLARAAASDDGDRSRYRMWAKAKAKARAVLLDDAGHGASEIGSASDAEEGSVAVVPPQDSCDAVKYPPPPLPVAPDPTELDGLAWSDQEVERYLVTPLRKIDAYRGEAYVNPDSPYGWNWREQFVAKGSEADVSGLGREVADQIARERRLADEQGGVASSGSAGSAGDSLSFASRPAARSFSFRDLFSTSILPPLKAYFASLARRLRDRRTRLDRKTASHLAHPQNNLARLLQPGEDNDKGHPDDTLTGKAIVHPDVHKALHCHALARLALDGALQDMLWLKKEVDNLSSSESKTSVEGPPSVVVPKISLDLTVDLVGLCFRGEKTQVMMKRPAAGVEGAMTVMRRPAGAAATMMRRPAAAFGYVDYRGDNDSDISESEGDDDNPGDEQTPQAPQEDRFVNSTVVFDRNDEFWPWLQHVRHTWSSGGRLDSVFPVGVGSSAGPSTGSSSSLSAPAAPASSSSSSSSTSSSSSSPPLLPRSPSSSSTSSSSPPSSWPFRMRGRLLARDPLADAAWNVTDSYSHSMRRRRTLRLRPVGEMLNQYRTPLNLLLANMMNEIAEVHLAARRNGVKKRFSASLDVVPQETEAVETIDRHGPPNTEYSSPDFPDARRMRTDVYASAELGAGGRWGEVEEVDGAAEVKVRDQLLVLLEAFELRFETLSPAPAGPGPRRQDRSVDTLLRRRSNRVSTCTSPVGSGPARRSEVWAATREELRGFRARPNVVFLVEDDDNDAGQRLLRQGRRRGAGRELSSWSLAETAANGRLSLALLLSYGVDPRVASPTPLSFNVENLNDLPRTSKDLLIRKTEPYELVTWLVSQPELRGFLPLLCRSQLERVQATLARTIEKLEGTTDPVRARDKTAAERAFHAFQEMALNSLQPYRYLDTRGKVVEALRRALQVQTLYLQMQIASSFAFGFHRGTAAVALKDEHGDSYAYPSLLDRPELLEATVTAARKRFAELGRTTLVAGPGGEGQARGHQVDPHPDSMMAELLRGVSLVALFGHQAGRKPKVAQFFVKEWLDELKQAAAAPGAHVGVEVDAIAFAKYVNDYPRVDVEHILSVSPSTEYNVRLPRNELNLNQVVGFFPRHNITGRYDRGLSPSMNLLQYWATQHNPELEGTRHGYIPPEIMLQMLRGKHANSFRFSSDSATVTSLRRYEALSLLVDKWGLPLWRPKWTQEGDITVAGEVCRWIDMEQSEDEDDDSVPDRRTPRSDRLEAYLLLHDEVDEYRGRHSVSVDEQDRSSTNRSPKCDAVLVHAAVHNQAQHFFNRTSTDEEEEPKRIENEIEIDSPFYDHEAWKQAEKASYERRGPFGGPAADRLRSLYSGVQIMRAAAAGSAVREAALLLAFGEKPATEDEVLLEALLPPWGAAGTLAKAEREAEREALLEKVKAVSRARRGRAHWHAADNHRGDHGALTAPTYQVLHSQVLRLLNILPKWAPDLSVAELKKKSFLTDVELARLLLALREDVARQPDAFWVGEGAADSVAAHLLDPGQVIYQVLFTDHSTHEKVVANSLQANVMKDDVQKQREFMKVEVLRYLDELLRVRGEEGTAMSIFYEDSEDLPDLATGRSRNDGSDSKKGSSVVRELFPGPLEAGSREAKPDRKPREMPSIFLRRTDAELVALLYVFYTKQREQAGAHDLAERQGSVEQKPEGVSEPLPDGFTALVRVILENQNEYWAEHSSHGNGLTNPSCVDGRIERLQISLIGRVTLPEDPSRWKLMKNTGDLQLLHFLSDLFANSLERSQAEKRVSAAGGAAKVYPALQQHEVLAKYLPGSQQRETCLGLGREIAYATEVLLEGKQNAVKRIRDSVGLHAASPEDPEFKRAMAHARWLVANRLLQVHADLWREDTLLFARLATIAAANDDSRSLDQEKQEVPSANSTSNQEQKKALAAESYLFLIDHQTPSRNRVREDSVDENAISELERVQEPQDEAAAGEEDPATKLARKLGVSTKQDRAEVEEKLGKFTRLVDAIVRSLLSMENAGKISEWVRVEQ